MDPAGVLLNAVGAPIKAYLRSRKDTIRCIVASLTDDAEGGEAPHGESLFEELKQPPEPEVRCPDGFTLAVQSPVCHLWIPLSVLAEKGCAS